MNNTPGWKVYTMENCPYCRQAKALLKQRGIEFEEISVDANDDAEWERLLKVSGMRTMPQIFQGTELIGGYTDLVEWDRVQGLQAKDQGK